MYRSPRRVQPITGMNALKVLSNAVKIFGLVLLLIGLSGIVNIFAIGLSHVGWFDVIGPVAVLFAAWLMMRDW